MPTIIPPSIGRVVLFRPGPALLVNSELTTYSGQPMDAHVVHVWTDRLINIAGFDHAGKPFARTLIRLIQEGDDPARDGESVCTWMDYQLGQAKKYEALEAKNSSPPIVLLDK